MIRFHATLRLGMIAREPRFQLEMDFTTPWLPARAWPACWPRGCYRTISTA